MHSDLSDLLFVFVVASLDLSCSVVVVWEENKSVSVAFNFFSRIGKCKSQNFLIQIVCYCV